MPLAVLLAALLLAAPVPQSAPQSARVVFSKSFPGSSPDYFEIELDASGNASYREARDDDSPLRFQLAAQDAAEIFGLAQKLDHFKHPLETKLKVANMGMKTLRYESGDLRSQTSFNYSEDLNARALVDWFEKIAETEQHRIALERAARFDRLGVNKVLVQLEISWDKKRILAPEQLLPMLDRIATQPNYVHIAKARAASLAERIRAGKPQN